VRAQRTFDNACHPSLSCELVSRPVCSRWHRKCQQAHLSQGECPAPSSAHSGGVPTLQRARRRNCCNERLPASRSSMSARAQLSARWSTHHIPQCSTSASTYPTSATRCAPVAKPNTCDHPHVVTSSACRPPSTVAQRRRARVTHVHCTTRAAPKPTTSTDSQHLASSLPISRSSQL
jgi:hypothetical protein